MLHTVYLSFFDWDGVTVASWVGLGNYRQVLTDPDLRGAVLNALTLVVFFSWLPIVLGMLMVALLARHQRRGMTAFRLLFFVPQVVPLVAVGVTWRWMYGSDGAVNQGLRAVGLDTVTRAWLGDVDFALVAVGLVGTWAMSGLCMVLFLSGVQKVDPALYEAARIDGAGPVREFVTVTLPALRGEVAVALTVTTVAALASFDIVYVTTDGGPAGNTMVPGLLVYRLAFTQYEVGLAAAVATVLALLILAVVFTITRLVRPE
ncbi:sugar ABC transporter permease [Halostreptopolyspora alba]|uniref:Sugar ABC transporter permease n=2 Tax=Halostreptopolyspora alba TaxID=2487137 RepID=A0A3N0EBY8_9ACTN|nr:sugar ABC transporter permease [Nocardiopsaceae bacterium YIM 96095]